MNEQAQKTIGERKNKNKESVIEQLKKTPIVQIVCEKSGISRATYYRWRKDDPAFAEEADNSLINGKSLINDMAESQLISAIKDKNMTAIIFWLKSNHPNYATRVEVLSKNMLQEKLTPEQEVLIQKALDLASGANSLNNSKSAEEQNEPNE